MWHVSSRSGVATLRTAIHLLSTYLLTGTPPLQWGTNRPQEGSNMGANRPHTGGSVAAGGSAGAARVELAVSHV